MNKIFYRSIIKNLKEWALTDDRKPLILRGARQVGKTTAVDLFSKDFTNYIKLNLEKEDEAVLFESNRGVSDIFQSILLHKNITLRKGKTLLFIDEIQSSPKAVALLRYFYEDLSDIYVVSAGSLFEIMLAGKQISFPVGRVRFLFVNPLNFEEFLIATGEEIALEYLKSIPIPEMAVKRLFELFHTFTLIGGMPEIIGQYQTKKDVVNLATIYQSIMTSYIDDVGKYAASESRRHILKHCIETAPLEAGKRIVFLGFGKSVFKAREIGEALRTLERARLIYLLYPSTSTKIPILSDLKKSPRLQLLDTGILNYSIGLQQYYFKYNDLHSFYKGILAEHIVGQELISLRSFSHSKPVFWIRDKKQSQAKLDFILQYNEFIIPIEVKSGKKGTLRSLHQFVNISKHPYAIRLYHGSLGIEKAKTPEGKKYYLLNLPYFLTTQIYKYIQWFMDEVKSI